MDLLHPTETITACAYKGLASYWSATIDATVVDDVAWSFAQPHNYATAVKDMLSSSTSASTSPWRAYASSAHARRGPDADRPTDAASVTSGSGGRTPRQVPGRSLTPAASKATTSAMRATR